jgi:hypothetical protein
VVDEPCSCLLDQVKPASDFPYFDFNQRTEFLLQPLCALLDLDTLDEICSLRGAEVLGRFRLSNGQY